MEENIKDIQKEDIMEIDRLENKLNYYQYSLNDIMRVMFGVALISSVVSDYSAVKIGIEKLADCMTDIHYTNTGEFLTRVFGN